MSASTEPQAGQPLAELAALAQRQAWLFGALVCTVSLLLPFGLILEAWIEGEDYRESFWGEWNAISWFSSVQLVLVGAVAFANHQADALLRRLGGSGTARYPWIWLLFAAGFVFLGLDERFEYHEWLRDEVFRPEGMFNVPFLRAGDVTMYGYLAVGLVFAGFLFRELLDRPLALFLFGGAVLLAGSTVVLDTLDKDLTEGWVFRYFWTSAYEEAGEVWAQSLFLASFLVVLHGRLKALGSARLSAPEGG